jgi:hypothetical protein
MDMNAYYRKRTAAGRSARSARGTATARRWKTASVRRRADALLVPMPSATPRADRSVKWPTCISCRGKHAPDAVCGGYGIWLVLSMCRDCNPRTGAYCGAHRA